MIIVLDTNILGALTNPQPKSPTVFAILSWALLMRQAGHSFAVPAIAVYEVRRELLRSKATTSIAYLDASVSAASTLYLPMTDEALTRAADLWAVIRNAGLTTAKDAALDGDVILMAQVLEANFAGSYVIATDNLKHFQSWVNADNWQNIVP